MDPEDVRRSIRNLLEREGQLPTKRRMRHYALCRQVQGLNTSFRFDYEDFLRLEERFVEDRKCWLLFESGCPENFTFYVVPYQDVRFLFEGLPFICLPASKCLPAGKPSSKFTGPVCTPHLQRYQDSHRLSLRQNKKLLGDYKNRADLFEACVKPRWDLFEKAHTPLNLFRRCECCGQNKLPDYKTTRHDYQCRNGKCHLLWCGDYWLGESDEVRQTNERRAKAGQPCERGWWKYSEHKRIWVRCDERGKPLDPQREVDPVVSIPTKKGT